MKSKWDISGFIKKVEDEVLEDAFNVIGGQSVTWASQNLRDNGSVITKNLLNSLAYATEKTQSSVSGTDGQPLEKADKRTLKVGTSVVYAARVEFGFDGQDSLGRTYNQPAKPYLRTIFETKRKQILAIMQSALT